MQEATTRIISTHQFGELHISPEQIFTFPQGIVGFAHLTEYVIISDDSTAPIQWLIAMEDSTIGLPVINALIIDMQYKPALDVDATQNTVFVVVNLAQGQISVNMKAPIVMNSVTMLGEQTVLSSERYQTDFILRPKA